jgi:hypothetical protein
MNKTYLIAGGASVVSLAVGAAGGYLFAKRTFLSSLEEVVAREVNETKKYYSVLLMQAREKPESPEDVVITETPPAPKVDPAVEANGKKALTDYQTFAANGVASPVESNIFDQQTGKKRYPPRDPKTGHFVKKDEPKEETPYLITEEEFLDDEELNSESLWYYANDDTLVLVADIGEALDNAVVGEVNLTLFPSDADPSVIYVRNEGLSINYQITRTYASLTEEMGLGDTETGDEIDEEEVESDLHLQH